METKSEIPERELPTADLVKHALQEARLLVRAELMHAKQELREEISAAKFSGMLLGGALVLGLSGISLLFVALALVLPLTGVMGALAVGVALLALAGGAGYAGFVRLPKTLLAKTQARLKSDINVVREFLA